MLARDAVLDISGPVNAVVRCQKDGDRAHDSEEPLLEFRETRSCCQTKFLAVFNRRALSSRTTQGGPVMGGHAPSSPVFSPAYGDVNAEMIRYNCPFIWTPATSNWETEPNLTARLPQKVCFCQLPLRCGPYMLQWTLVLHCVRTPSQLTDSSVERKSDI